MRFRQDSRIPMRLGADVIDPSGRVTHRVRWHNNDRAAKHAIRERFQECLIQGYRITQRLVEVTHGSRSAKAEGPTAEHAIEGPIRDPS